MDDLHLFPLPKHSEEVSTLDDPHFIFILNFNEFLLFNRMFMFNRNNSVVIILNIK